MYSNISDKFSSSSFSKAKSFSEKKNGTRSFSRVKIHARVSNYFYKIPSLVSSKEKYVCLFIKDDMTLCRILCTIPFHINFPSFICDFTEACKIKIWSSQGNVVSQARTETVRASWNYLREVSTFILINRQLTLCSFTKKKSARKEFRVILKSLCLLILMKDKNYLLLYFTLESRT